MDTIAIPELQHVLQNRLREWVNQQPGSITAEEAAEFLGMPQDSDGTYYGMATIGAALEQLGCEKEVLIHYWPPAARLSKPEQPLHPNDKTELQNVINIIREWVLMQTEPFTIPDIYRHQAISGKLSCNHKTMQLIHKALLALRCTVNTAETNFTEYNPPNMPRVIRAEPGEIYS